MKLFIWNNVLQDYSAGIAVVLAANVDAARYEVAQVLSYSVSALGELGFDAEPDEHEITTPGAFVCWGGG
jgi:hypothetical protein